MGMKGYLILALFLVAGISASPINGGNDGEKGFKEAEENLVDLTQPGEQRIEIDLDELVADLTRLHESANDVMQRVEETIATLKSVVPHSIKKRQTTVDGSVERGPGGATGRVDVNHKRGGTVYNGNYSRGPGGSTFGAGVSHSGQNTNWGANVSRGRGGTSFGGNYGRTWNNGRTSLGLSGGRSGGGNYGRISFTHRF